MAALLLRQGAARRLGASMVQRPRLMHMHTQEQVYEGIVREIQQKKDELYDLVSQAQKNVRTSTWPNAWLLQYLCEEVTPRPYDPDWHDWKKVRRVTGGIRRSGVILLPFVAVDYHNSKELLDLDMMMA